MGEIYRQLSQLLEHLGEKRIAVLSLGGFEMRFDFGWAAGLCFQQLARDFAALASRRRLLLV